MTISCAGCGVLRERCWERDDVCAVVEAAGGGSAAAVADVRMVQRADVRGQRVWACCMGCVDAVPVGALFRLHSRPYERASAVLSCAAKLLGSRFFDPVRARVHVPQYFEADGA